MTGRGLRHGAQQALLGLGLFLALVVVIELIVRFVPGTTTATPTANTR